jgi:flagellar protein FliO/FliZ
VTAPRASLLSRLLAHPRGRAAALGLGVLAALALAAAPGDLAPAAARAALAVGAVGAAAALVRRTRPRPAGEERLSLVSSRPLARDAGVALLEVEGRALLVGFGAEGVSLLADLGPAARGERP